MADQMSIKFWRGYFWPVVVSPFHRIRQVTPTAKNGRVMLGFSAHFHVETRRVDLQWPLSSSSSSSILFQATWPIKTRTSRNRKKRTIKHRNKLYSTLDWAQLLDYRHRQLTHMHNYTVTIHLFHRREYDTTAFAIIVLKLCKPIE